MATYWVLCLDGARVKHHLDFEAEDDAEAMDIMTLRQENCDCEIWCANRRVATMQKGGSPVLEAHLRLIG